MVYTLQNILENSIIDNPVKYSRVIKGGKWEKYMLERDVTIQLSNGKIITIPYGFKWDLSSVPKIFWSILAPDGDFAIASLIHDYLYIHRGSILGLKESDKEMLLWSKAVNITKNPISLKRIDNYVRYYGVRLVGWFVWYEYGKKIKNFFKLK